MKKLFFLGILIPLFYLPATAQNNTLFDDNRLSSVHITINPDTLEWIMKNVLSDHYFMARFVFNDTVHSDTLENVGFRLRGNTSRYALKKSFKISFSEYVSGRKYQGVKKINLNAEHNDPTMIREKLFYDIWNKAGMVKRRSTFVRLYINEVYYGLYTNLEEMDKVWLGQDYPNNSGNLYKCNYPGDLVYLGDDQQTYKDLESYDVMGGRVYELQTNETADDYTRLVALIEALDAPADSLFAINIEKILNTGHFLKALALDVASGNADDYSYNRTNYYLYDSPAEGRFDYIAYDPDNSFGCEYFGIDWGNRDCMNWINRDISLPLAQKMLAVPSYVALYKQYLDTIANTLILPDSVFPRIDAMKQLIQKAAEEDTFRSLDYDYTIADFNNGFIMTIPGHTPYGVKPFLETRHNSLLKQLHPDGIGRSALPAGELRLYPNPARDYINVVFNESSSRFIEGRIVDCYGRTIREIGPFMIKNGNFTLKAGELSPGLYLLILRAGEKDYQAKFIRSSDR
jgi:hypothetical protein